MKVLKKYGEEKTWCVFAFLPVLMMKYPVETTEGRKGLFSSCSKQQSTMARKPQQQEPRTAARGGRSPGQLHVAAGAQDSCMGWQEPGTAARGSRSLTQYHGVAGAQNRCTGRQEPRQLHRAAGAHHKCTGRQEPSTGAQGNRCPAELHRVTGAQPSYMLTVRQRGVNAHRLTFNVIS